MSKHLAAVQTLFGSPEIRTDSSVKTDAIDLATIARALTFVETEIQKVQYPEIQFRKICPVKSSGIDKGAENYNYIKSDRFGVAKMIDPSADDFPELNLKVSEDSFKVKHFGAHYSYNLQQLAAAAMNNIQLDSEDAINAGEALERALDQYVAVGNSELGRKGLLNDTGVHTDTSSTTWAVTYAADDSGGANIVNELLASENYIFSQSKGLFSPNTLVMSHTKLAFLRSKMVNKTAFNSESILSAYLKASSYINNASQIIPWVHCATAASGGGEMIAFMASDPSFRNFLCPMSREMEVLPAQPKALKLKTYCWASTFGAVVKQPLSLVYRDGI
jgi:hypothetical protein